MDDPARQKKVRRFGLLLLGVVALLAGLTFAYVGLYDRLLRDPNLPPSAKGLNPRVLTFEAALWAAVVLAVGVLLNRFLRRRR